MSEPSGFDRSEAFTTLPAAAEVIYGTVSVAGLNIAYREAIKKLLDEELCVASRLNNSLKIGSSRRQRGKRCLKHSSASASTK